MRVIAVDPGLASGLAAWEGELRLVEEHPPMELLDCADRLVDVGTVIVVEAFRITQETVRKSRQHDALELIGGLRWIAHRRGAELVPQGREKKAFAPDARLRALGWYTPTRGGHANDAVRHLVAYLAGAGALRVPVLG